jgi:hypothetical protein
MQTVFCILPAACLAALAGCSPGARKHAGGERNASENQAHPSLILFLTTELKGSVEPCGCTTDPLGDLARTAALVKGARRPGGPPVVHLDGGSTLFSEKTLQPHRRPQERLRAALLVRTLRDTLQTAAVGLGPYDLSDGVAQVALPRQVANLAPASGVPLAPPRLIDAGTGKIGVFGVVAPAAVQSAGLQASDPGGAARSAVASLRQQGAQLVVALAHMTRPEAVQLARQVPGIDLVLIGQKAPDEVTEHVAYAPSRIGDTWLVQPADRGQVVTRIDLSLRGAGLHDALGKARAEHEQAALAERIAALRQQLAEWRAAADADRDFVAARERELAALEAERTELGHTPLRIPASGSWFVMQQVRIAKALPCDPGVRAAKTEFDRAAGQANLAAAGTAAPPPPRGQAGYVGVEECGYCHAPAVEFWQKTRHVQAWDTLVERNKQLHWDCIGCHVTGWDRPGGATLAKNEQLRDVQCEVCHGPGSIHVERDGADKPRTVVRSPAQSLCVGCHSAEHSDTFQFEAYLRDVTGPGHGEALRRRLGDGPTGRELRAAGLARAGKAIGAGCVK